jgi:hypothetical protein
MAYTLNRTHLTGFQYAKAPAPAVIVLKHRGSLKTLLFRSCLQAESDPYMIPYDLSSSNVESIQVVARPP